MSLQSCTPFRSIPRQHGAVAGGDSIQLAARGGCEVFLPLSGLHFHPREELGGSQVPVNISKQQHFVKGLGSVWLQESRRVLVCDFRALGMHREERGVCVPIK